MPAQKTVTVYECARCGEETYADTPFRDDAPEGYYTTVRRVTEYRNHSVTPEVYLCSKECLIEFFQYEISAHAAPVVPIGRPPKRGY